MQNRFSLVVAVLLGGLSCSVCFPPLAAQNVSDFAVQLGAGVQSDPPQINLWWPTVDGVVAYKVSRKLRDDIAWGDPVSLPAGAAGYVDTNVLAGTPYEYHVVRVGTNYTGHGYIYAGMEAPLVESRGKLILVVESTLSLGLANELKQLQQDLAGDGWIVLRHDVPRMATDPGDPDLSLGPVRSNEVAVIKRLIQADYAADPANVKALFLFGHVPVPYSGAVYPDRHPDHQGAWPADVYYGDMAGTWTDGTVTSTAVLDPRNRNLPGDGKFDQSYPPAPLALQIGRVDLSNLPIYPVSEVELLRNYLNKDHLFRQKQVIVSSRGLVQDNLGILLGEAPAANGWANLAPLVGALNVSSGRWLTDLSRQEYLWAYGCGSGTYTQAAGVVDSSHFLVYDIKVVFAMLFGSFFGDWDVQNNLLRCQLAAPNYSLAVVWGNRPNWFFHHMALGETIGFSARLTQNNTGLYLADNLETVRDPNDPANFVNQVHIELLGDPTLRLNPVSPPTALQASTNAAGTVDLSWTPSADSVLGYHVYRAASPDGPYTRLTPALIMGTSFSDPTITAQPWYMVRAVKLEFGASGSYYNPSQGSFAQVPLAPVGTNTWGSRETRTWTLDDAAGTAGSDPGWQLVTVDGLLNVAATPDIPFTVQVASTFPDGSPGPPANFNPDKSYVWPIATASGGIGGFSTNNIQLVTSDFRADLAGGTLKLALASDSNAVNLVFTPNRPPVAGHAGYDRQWDSSLSIDIADLLAQFTSDPDGDARALLQVGPSTNGASIVTDGKTLLFTPVNNLAETFPYWIQDVRPYRPGDTVRVSSGTISVKPVPDAPPFSAYHAIEIAWPSEPGKSYQLQSRLETEKDWTNQGDPITGSGENMSLFERASNVTKFYRVILVQ